MGKRLLRKLPVLRSFSWGLGWEAVVPAARREGSAGKEQVGVVLMRLRGCSWGWVWRATVRPLVQPGGRRLHRLRFLAVAGSS